MTETDVYMDLSAEINWIRHCIEQRTFYWRVCFKGNMDVNTVTYCCMYLLTFIFLKPTWI